MLIEKPLGLVCLCKDDVNSYLYEELLEYWTFLVNNFSVHNTDLN